MKKTYKVNNKEEAQMAIAQLLEQFAGDSAKDRVRQAGRFSKQSDAEVFWRVAGNLLTSFSTTRF